MYSLSGPVEHLAERVLHVVVLIIHDQEHITNRMYSLLGPREHVESCVLHVVVIIIMIMSISLTGCTH